MIHTIENPYLWNRFKNFFGIDRSDSDDFTISTRVQPVTVIDDKMAVMSQATENIAVSAGGIVTVCEAPVGKPWQIFMFSARTTSNFTFDKFTVTSPRGGSSLTLLQIDAKEVEMGLLPAPIILDSGDIFGINISPFIAAGTMATHYRYLETDMGSI